MPMRKREGILKRENSDDEFERALEQIADRFNIRAGSLTAYDPSFDQDGRALEACKRILVKLADLAAKADRQ